MPIVAVCLMQQVGVGPVTALAFVLTVGPVSRFPNSKKLALQAKLVRGRFFDDAQGTEHDSRRTQDEVRFTQAIESTEEGL